MCNCKKAKKYICVDCGHTLKLFTKKKIDHHKNKVTCAKCGGDMEVDE